MEIRQKLELRKLLAPQLQQSLKILTLSLPDLKIAAEEELLNNPLLEEIPPEVNLVLHKIQNEPSLTENLITPQVVSTEGEFHELAEHPKKSTAPTNNTPDLTNQLAQMTRKPSLQDILLRQLGMFAESNEELHIGESIIGNLDENGYLKISLEEIVKELGASLETAEKALKNIQQFDPPGIAARSISECLLIQLKATNENNPLLEKIIISHLDDVARKNYTLIAKTLNQPLEVIETLIKKIQRLDPKPGRNYSNEEIQNIIPDIIVREDDDILEIIINNEDIPGLNISQEYKEMLKNNNLAPETKNFLTQKLHRATELLRAISKRQVTLRRVVETVMEIQEDALKTNLSNMKPLTFQEVAKKLDLHETTICRVVMNKYVYTPFGVVSLKSFFPGRIQYQNGESLSNSHAKSLIKDMLDQEDKKHPLSDQEIVSLLEKNHALKLARRTVAKYREELKILSSALRKIR